MAKPAIPWPQGASSPEMKERIASAKILAVGAGGIGCELLKTLVLTGFKNIEAIDLDTIEVSNLNRQFLFRKHHVGQSKASVAADAVKQFRPDVSISAHQANIKESKYDIDYFKGFDLVLNGLDNLDARRHVNRRCLAAGVPLVESGTAGYLGQVSVHVGGTTECFDCTPKPTPKSYAVCTIRTSPDKPIHCVVWAKELLFPLLFGDTNGEKSDLDPKGKLTRGAEESANDFAKRVFQSVFADKINEVLETAEEDIWVGRKRPVPVILDAVLDGAPKAAAAATGTACEALGLNNQHAVWTPQQSAAVFLEATRRMLEDRAGEMGSLSFDKDDDLAVEFVAAAANLRSLSYHIPAQSLFDTKGMAGNIIHAIATTNAIISGLIVIEALKLLASGGDPKASKTTFLRQDISNRKIITPTSLEKPNPRCAVCGTARLQLRIDTATTTLGDLVSKVLRGHLGLVEPTIMFGNSNAMFQYEEGEDLDEEEVEENAVHLPKMLAELPGGGLVHNTVVEIKDQKQHLDLQMVVCHQEQWDEEVHPLKFIVEGEVPAAAAQAAEEEKAEEGEAAKKEGDAGVPVGKKRKMAVEDDDGALVLMDSEDEGPAEAPRKRGREDENGDAGTSKKAKVGGGEGDDDDVIELLD